MKIYVFPADQWGCGKYRMWWPAEALKAQGHDIEICMPGDQSGISGFARDGRIYEVMYPPDADIIVIQRPLNGYLAQCVPMIIAKGVTVIVEMDDDLSNVHPANPAFNMMHPKLQPKANWQHCAAACRDASMVIVSTEALIPRYASHGRFRVVPNCIPERFLQVEHQDSDTVGWAGALHSHPDDPRVLGPALARAGRSLRVVGPNDTGLDRAFGCKAEATGVIEFDQWADGVTSIGVGLAPLADTQFNQCKSWLKPLEYASLGVPWIGSASVEYTKLHKRGCGFLADKPKEWAFHIKRLAGSAEARQEASEAGRLVASELTIEANAWRWLEAWMEAHDATRSLSHPVFYQ